MKTKWIKPFIILAIVLIPAIAWQWPNGWNSIGFVGTVGGFGSCVCTEKGIFSAKHCSNKGYPANFEIIKEWKKLDLIKIRLTDNQKLEPALVAKYIDPDKPVYFIGFISLHQKVVKYGHIMGRVSKKWDSKHKDGILVDMTGVPGMSGGGVFQDGKVIGVTSAAMVYQERGALFSLMVPLPGVHWKE